MATDEYTDEYYIKEIKDEPEYDIKISIKKNPENVTSYYNLHLVHVEVNNKDEKPLSETYTYFEGTVRSNP